MEKSTVRDLLKLYDGFAWIPTIRGALSLEVIDNADNLLGDVDKYAVSIKKHVDTHSEHYIVASSMQTVNDSKYESRYHRTFRYFFTGVINSAEAIRLYKEQFLKNQVAELSGHFLENVLLGHLTIINEYPHKLTDLEAYLIYNLKCLASTRKHENQGYGNATPSDIVNEWNSIKEQINQIEHDQKNKRNTYSFDILLARDGILLLKDQTSDEYRKTYATPNTEKDYTQTVPLPSIFNLVMNYVKYLFHVNYHHNLDHDTFLPASNLHTCKKDCDYKRVVLHQMNYFLDPLTRMKRAEFKDYTSEPLGIALYTKSFINVCKKNRLIDEQDALSYLTHIDIIYKEIELMTEDDRNFRKSILGQLNPVFVWTGILGFVVACLKIFTTFIEISKLRMENLCLQDVVVRSMLMKRCALLTILVLIGYSLYRYSRTNADAKHFKRCAQPKNYFKKNSHLDKGTFSRRYLLLIQYYRLKLLVIKKIGQERLTLIKIIALLCVLIAVLAIAIVWGLFNNSYLPQG